MLISFASCYDDIGNYKYSDINELEVILNSVYEMKIPNSGIDSLKIIPKINQSINTDNDNLAYRWRKRNNGYRYDIILKDKDIYVTASIEDSQDIYLRFEAIDTILGIVYAKDVTVLKRKPFEYGWFVLQNKKDKVQLGAIDGRNEDAEVVIDMNSVLQNQLTGIVGKPKMLGPNMYYKKYISSITQINIPLIDICTDKMGYRYEVTGMKKIYEYPDLLIHKKNEGDNIYDISYVNFDGGEIILEGGTFWYANGEGDGFHVFYPVKKEGDKPMDYVATYAYTFFLHQYSVVYDSKHHQLLWYPHSAQDAVYGYNDHNSYRNGNHDIYDIDGRRNSRKLLQINYNKHDINKEFDPKDIGNKEVVYMGCMADKKLISIASEMNTNSIYAYLLSTRGLFYGSEPNIAGYFNYQIHTNVEDACFATSIVFNKSLFVTGNNVLYRLDFDGTSVKETEVFRLNSNSGAKFLKCKFENEQETAYVKQTNEDGEPVYVNHNLYYRLGIVVKYGDGEWGVLVIQLDENGDYMEHWEYKKDKMGNKFSTIVDIAYISHFII